MSARQSRHTRRRKRRAGSSVKITGRLLLLAVLGTVVWWVACAKHNDSPRDVTDALEGSLEEVRIPAGVPEKLLRYTGMTVSFNNETHQPNYVVWELLGSEAAGTEPRTNDFFADTSVKGSAYPEDYKYTGYDRGHMAPAGDMKWDEKAMHESFLMTNMCPQAPELNRGAWKKLEEKCRAKAMADSAVIIVCGPIFDTPEPSMRIGNTGVAVPDRFFKVVLSPYTDPPQAIGFIMPNGPVPGGMQPHAVTIDSVESVTGFDFFSALPDDLEERLESSCNFNRWSHTSRRRK